MAGDAAFSSGSFSGDGMVPAHIAIIMDGNGRWAKKRGLPHSMGHRQGVEAVKDTVEAASKMGVSYLTLYAFSTENWKRPEDEVRDLMGLLRFYLNRHVAELKDQDVRLRVIGRRTGLASDIIQLIEKAEEDTAHNEGMVLMIALNYGGRDEILDATRAMARAVLEGRESVEAITEERFESFLSTYDVPDPDLLIRTSGEQRISNFLLWQCAYTEFVFQDVLWPDYGGDQLQQAIQVFRARDRRFGGRVAAEG